MTPTKATLATTMVATLAVVAALAPFAFARASTTVIVGDDYFSPTSTTISAGTTVKFKWVDDGNHDVVKKKGPGGGFSSGITDQPGVNFKKKFKKAGTYKLICSVHPEDMKLKLSVN